MTHLRPFLGLCVLFLILSVTSCTVGRFVIYNFADISDHKKFPARVVENGEHSFVFPSQGKGRAPKTLTLDGEQISFDEFLEDNRTVAFLIIQNDSIQYEQYFNGYDAQSIVPSFSMAKSVTSILIGCAIEDGLIRSVDDPVTDYLPELRDEGFDKVSIEHVLQMTSGLEFNESYVNPFGHAASFYYGRTLEKATLKLKLKAEPGTSFEYVSGNTQILGLILQRVLQERSISNYLEEKLWRPLQMEAPASWSIDKKNEGVEKTFCCINAIARDYAKIGRLLLNEGNWEGEQIISAEWVQKSTMVDTSKGSVGYYQYQWWLPTETGDFMAQGILGQYIYVHPDKDLIIVRLGKNHGKANWWNVLAGLGRDY